MRCYDPATAQFLSRDPVEALTREPYAYGRDNPANNIDPGGLFGFDDITDFGGDVLNSLNPVKYYEEEVECLEEGCSYWEAVSHGAQGAATLACDATGAAALGKGILGRGGITLAGVGAAGEESSSVLFGHGARHLLGTGLSQAEVEAAIAKEVVKVAPDSGFFIGRISVGGRVIEYKAYTLSDGRINVGTYYTK